MVFEREKSPKVNSVFSQTPGKGKGLTAAGAKSICTRYIHRTKFAKSRTSD